MAFQSAIVSAIRWTYIWTAYQLPKRSTNQPTNQQKPQTNNQPNKNKKKSKNQPTTQTNNRKCKNKGNDIRKTQSDIFC
jgi:hypothetical protein